MKRCSVCLVIGLLLGLLVGVATFAVADSPIKLIVNGQEITCDTPPQVINGRTMVSARYVAEALGATVAWDADKNAVVVTGKDYTPQQVSDNKIEDAQTVKQPEILEDYCIPNSIKYNDTIYIPIARGLDYFDINKNIVDYNPENKSYSFTGKYNETFIAGKIENEADIIIYNNMGMIKETTLRSIIGK